MANFNTHLSVSIISSGLVSWTLHTHTVLPPELIIPATMLGILGGLMPDIDSDTSKPLLLFFNGLSFFIAIIFLLFSFEHLDWQQLTFIFCAIFILFRYLVIRLFMYFTIHRGIFHSVPIALLFGVLIANISKLLGCSDELSWAYGVLFFSGYILHLCLDELVSFDLRGVKFKRSFGTALKFFSFNNLLQYALLYCVLFIAVSISPNYEAFIAKLLSS